MAKVFIVLLSVLVVLNGMTFLVVVNQAAPGQGASSREADAAGKKPQGPDPAIQKLESLERIVQGVKGSMDRLSSKVDGLQAKVNQVASRPAVAATQPLPPPSAAPAGRPSSPVRRGPVDYSRITTPQASGAQESGGEEAANEEGPAPAEGAQPAPDQPPAEGAAAEGAAAEGGAAEGGAAEGGEEGAAEAAPAAEGSEGAAAGETPEGEGG